MDPLPSAAQLSFDELGSPLRETTFVVVDLETTGGRADEDAITEIGAVKVRGGEVLGEFGTLVDPGRGIPPTIVALTGITQAMVADAPRMDTVLPAFLEFAAGSVLVAHNAGFDVTFLRAACERFGYPWPKPQVLCTLKLARRVLTRDEAPSCRLAALAELFQASTRPVHRALDDARATVDVLHGLLERVGPLGVHSLEELLAFLPEVTPAQRRKRQLAAHLPNSPGVYLFRGPREEVLYVGTASDLRRRVRQYFTAGETRRRVREMVGIAERVDAVECAHSLEAEVRELRLLAAHQPRYNRRSKFPHRAWWVVLTDEAFPRLSVVREPRETALGPFSSRNAAQEAVEALQDVVPVRRCTLRISPRRPDGRPCALAEIGRCGAPCAGRQTVEEYSPAVRLLTELLAGRSDEPLVRLRRQVEQLAEDERFEDAGARRDRLVGLLRALIRGQRLAAVAAVPELVAARPDGDGGWELAVVRHGRLAAAGVARRGVPPMPVVDALQAGAETVLPGPGPLRGASADEVAVVRRWLVRPGTRLVRCAEPWREPVRGAASWHAWLAMASAGAAGYAAAD
ncbi:DNA polymerase-3 subunit epsilon [Streptoalloteichus tenebrarius]|uniref:DNA polymerase-3 subunit epsilon n=1 Tax=Streptoalloteichus tenebrarius (strain ATCC 17920 / DSM 40477 / JCM 4838 / CBS 697.72 / NBRC 16177 / NCIMB 11028 / NRRL B-12390 / A12253. 1 / ISP 5477) TaxID=1933 RepID=A0ABT1HX48_STRSD|nr:DEDD exonuclease domain-containing protein [Streptoalloteichus tenebrarius]MCP2260097.1 DNA polymerase-3 subunit epsilon [Streptoalloteichus tenebrarius]BFF00583.1 DEDD exonuclease domain-containing protein [Streptoalloteichus tenebrarius]